MGKTTLKMSTKFTHGVSSTGGRAMTNTKTVVGWMSEKDYKRALKDKTYNIACVDVFTKRGTKEFWEAEWPPIKVKLTLEKV